MCNYNRASCNLMSGQGGQPLKHDKREICRKWVKERNGDNSEGSGCSYNYKMACIVIKAEPRNKLRNMYKKKKALLFELNSS